jgi:hypothetical protein
MYIDFMYDECYYNNAENHCQERMCAMSNREIAKNLIDQIPESRMFYVIAYLQGAAIPEESPNADTLEAMEELKNGGGHKFSGTTAQLFSELLED